MSAVIVAAEMVTCLGGTQDTMDGLFAGRIGAAPLADERTGVRHGYPIADGPGPGRVAGWLRDVVARVAATGGIRPREERVALVVGTGLRQFGDLEGWWAGEHAFDLDDLHFARACEEPLPGVAEVLTVVNACAASGYALALADDILTAGEHDAVIVAGCDGLAESMLTMIGRAAARPATAVRPFDADRDGVLLGEGAAAVALRARADAGLGLLRGVGVSCDAHHPTAPEVKGIVRCMRDAHARAAVAPDGVDVVIAHGTGTALNDPAEAEALCGVFGRDGNGPVVTGVKGALGHTSGAAALMSAIVALEALRREAVPPVAGLETPIPETRGLRLATERTDVARARVAQVDAFGFGGVNAVAILESATVPESS
jgi:3-oxoacyl-[acyl-carrier-protein] synthase II